jgi:hypothetical protein
MNTRVNTLLTVTFALVLPSVVVGDVKPEPVPPMTAEKWRADVDVFAKELPKRHKNAYHAITPDQFASAVAGLRAKAGQAHDDEMLVGLMQITAMVGDCHTRVNMPAGLHQYPIGVALIEGSYRVVRGAASATELVGGKLVRIDDTPLETALARIRTIVAQQEKQNDVLISAFTPQWFSVAEVMHGLGIAKSPASAKFTVVLDDGSERSADLAAIEFTAKPQWRAAAKSQPLYRQNMGETLSFTWLEEAKTVYVNFRTYEDLAKKARDLWTFVDSHPATKIVIDLRQNGGGDFNVGRKNMVDKVASRPKLRPYVITGGRTGSAAVRNTIDFRTVAKATLVGETIGERPNSYSENDEFRLPNTRLEISYSTQYYKFLPDSDGLVTPDKEILPTWADWVAGRDPVLDWVLSQ